MTTLFINERKVPAYGGPPLSTVRGGDTVTCGNGHNNSSVSRGWCRDRQDYYVEVSCCTAGCTAHSKVYDKDRGTLI